MFLLMGVWATLVPWVWLWPGLIKDPAFWHAHELIFGMAGAALGGYLLIALPSWTGPNRAHRIGRLPLFLLVLAWGLGRGSMLIEAQGVALLICASLYPLGLAGLVLLPLWRVRRWQKLPFAVVPVVLAVADVTWLAIRWRGLSDAPFGPAVVLGFAVLLSVVGGRAVPAFLNSRFQATGAIVLPLRTLGAQASGLIMLSIVLLIAQRPHLAGAAMMASGVMQSIRLIVWGRRALFAHLDLMMLYLAWAWLGIGLMLLGTTLLMPAVFTLATMLHALTIGAMGSMIMAVAGRAFMARAPGRLRASPTHVTAFAMISTAAVLRLVIPDAVVMGLVGLQWSILVWSLGWGLFMLPVLRSLARPSPHPVLSAVRAQT